MNIVKQFEDPDFYRRRWSISLFNKDGRWYWGLGDDGSLYFKCSAIDNPNVWYGHNTVMGERFVPTIKEMKRIVEEFAHLLPFI